MVEGSIYAFIATIGFGILFNIRGRNLFIAALGAGISWFCYLFTMKLTSSTFLAYFLASITAGVFSEVMARILKTPATTFVICSIIPLVPGSGMYYSMYEIIKGNASKALNLSLETLSIAGAVALGILFATSMIKIITYKKNNHVTS